MQDVLAKQCEEAIYGGEIKHTLHIPVKCSIKKKREFFERVSLANIAIHITCFHISTVMCLEDGQLCRTMAFQFQGILWFLK